MPEADDAIEAWDNVPCNDYAEVQAVVNEAEAAVASLQVKLMERELVRARLRRPEHPGRRWSEGEWTRKDCAASSRRAERSKSV